MRYQQARLALISPLLATALASAETAAPTEPSQTALGDLWNQVSDSANDWWQRSRELVTEAAADARRLLGDEHQDSFEQLWDDSLPRLEAALALEERQGELPERAWFGADQDSNRKAINALLDETVAILSRSPALRQRDQIHALRREIERKRAEIADYRQRRVSAPRESALARTVSDYDRLIAERENDIKWLDAEIARIQRDFARDLRTM